MPNDDRPLRGGDGSCDRRADLLFFKDRFWERLTANVGIVLIFVAFYFRFLKRP
jgi:hypothetical protein